MVMAHSGTRTFCHIHGYQLAKGCVIECPVCAHQRFLEDYDPEAVESFKEHWENSPYNQPAPTHGCFY